MTSSLSILLFIQFLSLILSQAIAERQNHRPQEGAERSAQAPRSAAPWSAEAGTSRRGSHGLHERWEVDAAQHPDARRGDGREHALCHARPHHAKGQACRP